HQRAVQFVRPSGEERDDASESDAGVSIGHGLYFGQWIATAGIERDRTGRSAGSDDPYEGAEDWRADPCDRAEGLGIDGFQLSVAGPVPASVDKPALLKLNRSTSSQT